MPCSSPPAGVQFLPDGAVARAERALTGGLIPWTIIRPTHFAENFTEAMFVPQNDTVIAPVSDGVEPFIDVEDIVQVAAEILAGGGWLNQTIEITSRTRSPSSMPRDRAARRPRRATSSGGSTCWAESGAERTPTSATACTGCSAAARPPSATGPIGRDRSWRSRSERGRSGRQTASTALSTAEARSSTSPSRCSHPTARRTSLGTPCRRRLGD
jgi:hypothetical protein